MPNFYQYLFYSIYQWNKKLAPNSEQPVLNSMLAVSLLMFCNLVILSLLLELSTGFKLINFEGVKALTIVSIIVGVILMNFLFLIYRKRYDLIIKRYSEFKSNKTINSIVGLYIIATVSTLVILLLYHVNTASN